MNTKKTFKYIFNKAIVLFVFLALNLAAFIQLNAQIFQHFDASIDSLVNTNASNEVTSWIDISGNGYNATPAAGNAIYPSSKDFNTGLKGIDFGDSRVSLQLLSADASDNILNQADNPTGFCIITAVYIESFVSEWNDLLGNNSGVSSGFFMRYSDSGILQTTLGGVKNNGSKNIQPGQAVIFTFNYDAANKAYKFWCSASDEELFGQVEPADFSNNSPLTIGSTSSSGRYFNGMVGEVQVYNASITKEKRKEIIYALGEKWGVDLPRIPEQPNPHIVNTIWSDSDVPIVNFNAAEAPYNADKTGIADATEAIQNALDDCGNTLGGVVYLPEGTYRLEGNLVFKDGVTLRGDWKEPTDTDKLVAGTVLNIYGSKGEDSDVPTIESAIELGASGGIRDLSIFYPEQDASNPVPYPYTIRARSKMQTVMNLTLVNSYKGIRYETSTGTSAVGHPNVYNVYGSPLKRGIRLNKAAAVPRIVGVDFDPAYWAESGLPASPTKAEVLNAIRSLESVALELEQSDNGILGDFKIKGYDVAIGIGMGGLSSNMKVYDFDISQCRVGVNAVNYKSQGWTFTKGIIKVDGEGAMAVKQPGDGILTFNDVAFSSTGKLVVSTAGSLSFTNCHFQEWNDESGVYMATGSLISYGNIFSKDLEPEQSHIYLDSGSDAAAISGNTFENAAAKIISMNSDTNLFVIDTTGSYEVYRHDYKSHVYVQYFVPAKQDINSLFNVLDFGAVGDMETENTAAFKAALKAAEQNGGGTVFVPGGAYRIDGHLVVPTGVELRGVHDVPVYTGHARSILLNYVDIDNPGDSAFITMQEASAIRGMVLMRPQQVYNEADSNVGTTIYDWPFAVRAAGDNCSIVNIVVANADKGIDLASSGGGHNIMWYLTAPIRMCLNVQTGANPIVIDNMQTNPGLFRDIKSTLNWNLFSDNTTLTGHFINNIAPSADESRGLYPSGTAVSIKGDGELTVFSNFYNSPFEGYIINGSPKMTTLLSGGEGDNFYKVLSEGAGGIELTIIANTYHPVGDDMSQAGFGSYQLNPGSTGIVKVLNTTSFGAPDIGYRINNGKLIVQSAFQTVDIPTWVEAKGNASVSIEGSFLRNGMSTFHGVERSDSAKINISGTFSQNSYLVSSLVNVSGSTPRTVIKFDLTYPSTPLNLEAEPVSSSQIDLSWDPSIDNTNVAGYSIFRDGLKIAEVSTTSYSDTGLNPETYYDYYVMAFDEAENESDPSESVAASTLSTAIEEFNKNNSDIKIYPNPAKNHVFILLSKTNDSEITVNLYSAAGSLILSKQVMAPAAKTEISLDVSSLHKGLYIYQIKDTDKTFTGKLYIRK